MLRRKTCFWSLDVTLNYPRVTPVVQTNARVDKLEFSVFRFVVIEDRGIGCNNSFEEESINDDEDFDDETDNLFEKLFNIWTLLFLWN